jgi:hypothetical protein
MCVMFGFYFTALLGNYEAALEAFQQALDYAKILG